MILHTNIKYTQNKDKVYNTFIERLDRSTSDYCISLAPSISTHVSPNQVVRHSSRIRLHSTTHIRDSIVPPLTSMVEDNINSREMTPYNQNDSNALPQSNNLALQTLDRFREHESQSTRTARKKRQTWEYGVKNKQNRKVLWSNEQQRPVNRDGLMKMTCYRHKHCNIAMQPQPIETLIARSATESWNDLRSTTATVTKKRCLSRFSYDSFTPPCSSILMDDKIHNFNCFNPSVASKDSTRSQNNVIEPGHSLDRRPVREDDVSIRRHPPLFVNDPPCYAAPPRIKLTDNSYSPESSLGSPYDTMNAQAGDPQDSTTSSALLIVDSVDSKRLITLQLRNLGVSLLVKNRRHARDVSSENQLIDQSSEMDSPKSQSKILRFSRKFFYGMNNVMRSLSGAVASVSGIPLWNGGGHFTDTLLRGLSGTFLPGRLVAILGPSGSGKSTLLNVLAGRLIHSEGDVLVNGKITNARELERFSAFIQQLDLFLPNLTVEEHLTFQAQLLLDEHLTSAHRNGLVRDTMIKFGLFKVRDTVIGSPDSSRGISGGERKRLSVASATLTNPIVLLADEPTTGLDAVMAKSVINSLRYLAASGRTVIASLHQPSTQTFSMFDEVLLLSGGRIIYFGDRLGSVEWMRRLGVFCSNLSNPSDFLIRCVSLPDNPSKRLEKKQQLEEWARIWELEGNTFLRNWTEGGRLAFFLSSRSLAERNIKCGWASVTPHISPACSSQSSVWSIENGMFQDNNYINSSIDASLPMRDPLNYSEIPRVSKKHHRFKFFNRHSLSLGVKERILHKPIEKKRSSPLFTQYTGELYSTFYPEFMSLERKSNDMSTLSQNPFHSSKDSYVFGVATVPLDNHTSAFFQSFHSAPPTTSPTYFLSRQSYFNGFARQKITSRSAKKLLKVFRYSGPRPLGHISNFNLTRRSLPYASSFSLYPQCTGVEKGEGPSIMGKPVSFWNQTCMKSCTVGVPEKPLILGASTQSACDNILTENSSLNKLIYFSQPYDEVTRTKRYSDIEESCSSDGLSQLPSNGHKLRLDSRLYLNQELCQSSDDRQDTLLRNLDADPNYIEKKKQNSFWYQLRVLTTRALTSNGRDPVLLYARALQTVVLAVIYGSMFFNLKDGYEDARTKVSAIFFVLTNQGLVGAAGVCSTFPEEKVVISREHDAGFLNIKAYIVGKMIADIPIQCVFPVLFNVITMVMMQLCTSWSTMILSCVVALAVCNSAITIGYLGSATAPSSDIALVITQVWALPALLFSGFIVILNDIPKFISWFQYLSYFRYGFIAYAQLVFDGEKIVHNTPLGSHIIMGNTFFHSYLGIEIGGPGRFWTQVACLFSMAVLLRLMIVIIIVPLANSWKEKPS